MIEAPLEIDEARVVASTAIDARHRPTGNCRHVVGGEPLGPVAGLAICQYAGEDGFYLFYCDANWESMTDTWHASIEDAEHQAEFEYEGTSATWQRRVHPVIARG